MLYYTIIIYTICGSRIPNIPGQTWARMPKPRRGSRRQSVGCLLVMIWWYLMLMMLMFNDVYDGLCRPLMFFFQVAFLEFFVIPVWSLPYLQLFWIALRLVWFGGQWISCFANATTLQSCASSATTSSNGWVRLPRFWTKWTWQKGCQVCQVETQAG